LLEKQFLHTDAFLLIVAFFGICFVLAVFFFDHGGHFEKQFLVAAFGMTKNFLQLNRIFMLPPVKKMKRTAMFQLFRFDFFCFIEMQHHGRIYS
jgi:hypothetical protein